MTEGVGRRDDFPTAGGRVTLERGVRIDGPDGPKYFRDILTADAYAASTPGYAGRPMEWLSNIALREGSGDGRGSA